MFAIASLAARTGIAALSKHMINKHNMRANLSNELRAIVRIAEVNNAIGIEKASL